LRGKGTGMKNNNVLWQKRRRRMFEIIEGSGVGDLPSRVYDIVSTLLLLINLTATVMSTFRGIAIHCGTAIRAAEEITVAFFAVDYLLRLWTARVNRPALSEGKAVLKYAFSLIGLIDLLSFLPHYMPFFFPAGTAVFRIFRVVRIFRLFQINAYYDSLHVITEVISSKKQQLVSSVFIILVLMLASSLCIYSLEHEAQPDIFENAFSGIWWAVSTLLTIGYGDIYPVTTMGKVFGIIIAFLGVGMVAIPTGIISAGFVDQYSRVKRMSEYAREEELLFIEAQLDKADAWVGKRVGAIGLPKGAVITMIRRGHENVIPRENTLLYSGDIVIIGSRALKDGKHIELKELVLQKYHPWNGQKVRDLNISRQTVLIMIKRENRLIYPSGETVLLNGDRIILCSREHIPGAQALSPDETKM